jgi:hypothetical protein
MAVGTAEHDTSGVPQPSACAEGRPLTLPTRGKGPHTALAISRSLNFWILPVEVFGISAKATWRGHL